MGNKFKKPNINCPACGKGFVLEDLRDQLYTEQTSAGEVCYCPKCDYQWIENRK